MSHGKFGTAINCMDGRVQLPVIEWMKQNYHLDYVDMITEPGADRAVSAGSAETCTSIRKRAEISIRAHGSDVIAVIGHDDCAGNPVSEDQHLKDIKRAVQVVQSWGLGASTVIGLWIGKDWKAKAVA